MSHPIKNILVGQSGGPTCVINGTLAGVFEEACRLGVATVFGMRYGIEGFLVGNVVNLTKHLSTPEAVELLRRTPSSYLGSCRYRLPEPELGNEVFAALFKRFEQYQIDAVFYIGGNDSMDTIAKLSRYGELINSPIRFIGLPKTIDNDLLETDHTPGYGSAAKYIAALTKELVCDCSMYKLKSVTLLEIMGRNAGWLTAAAALAKGPDCPGADMILLPEIPYDEDTFIAQIEAIQQQKGTVVIAVSEGLRDEAGKLLSDRSTGSGKVDSFGHKTDLSGTGRYLADVVSRRIGCKTRCVEFSTIQRCGSHIVSATDLQEAEQLGCAGVRAAVTEGRTGLMPILVRRPGSEYHCDIEMAVIANIANGEKKFPKEWITPDGIGVTEEYLAYARPLILGELTPCYKDGLPCHLPPL